MFFRNLPWNPGYPSNPFKGISFKTENRKFVNQLPESKECLYCMSLRKIAYTLRGGCEESYLGNTIFCLNLNLLA